MLTGLVCLCHPLRSLSFTTIRRLRWTVSSVWFWNSFEQDAATAVSSDAVEQLRVRWIGRKQGLLTRVGEVLKGAPAEARREVGKRFNALKSAIEPRCDPSSGGGRTARRRRRHRH